MDDKHGGYDDEPFLAEYYDLVQPYALRPDVGFYVAYSQAADGRTLELGCGTGRILIPTARAGCEIVGLDLSEHMLAKCREKLAREPEDVRSRVKLLQGDMTDFDLGEKFALITTPFRPFQHLVSVEEQLACLRCVRRHLATGGKFILEVFQTSFSRISDPKYDNEIEDVAETDLPDGSKFRRAARMRARHRSEQYNDVEIIYYVTHPDGRKERVVQAFPFRYFFRFELEHLFARAGFRIVELLGGFDRSPLGDESPEMIFVTEKTQDASVT